MAELKNYFVRTCINCHPCVAANGPVVYKDEELSKLSKEAYFAGEEMFYADYDKEKKIFVKSNPNWVFRLKHDLTPNEMRDIEVEHVALMLACDILSDCEWQDTEMIYDDLILEGLAQLKETDNEK